MPLPAVAAGVSIFATAVSFLADLFGTVNSANAAARERDLRRQIAELEVQRVESQIRQVREDTQVAARDFQQEGVRIHGRQVLAYARSGARLAGSPLARLAETDARIEEGVRRINERGSRTTRDLRAQQRAIRLRGESQGLDPGAVVVSRLPGLLARGFDLADQLGAFDGFSPEPSVPAVPALGGGGTAETHFRDRPTASLGIGVTDDILY